MAAISTSAPTKSLPPSKSKQEEIELAQSQHGVQNGTAEASLPLEQDIMQCARIGALEYVQAMIQSGKHKPTYADEEGITPLMWAAINNQYAVCKYLIEAGANINATGGESQATAVMWAAQRCNFYIVNLMIQHGADLTILDAQGYNILHLATIDGNALLLLLLLLNNVSVDVVDPQGHTSLMWAGYKGWPACVDLLLRWGASVSAKDDAGLTPLHWALVKGSKPCLEKLIEYGADLHTKTNDGKSPFDTAKEMNSRSRLSAALASRGLTHDGSPRTLPLGLQKYTRSKTAMTRFLFIYPFFILISVAYIIATFPIYIGFPLSLGAGLGFQYIAQYLCNYSVPEFHNLHKTPYLAGIFAGTLFWVGFDWITRILPYTHTSHPFSNLFFALCFATTTYFWILSMSEDPGYVPKLNSRNQQREAVQELFAAWKFDEESFCIQCLIRRPLRSKHCRRCGRCVSKQDHHCPWINSCVANNNLRHFFLYIVFMEFGIFLFVRLVLAYLEKLPVPVGTNQCNILPDYLCTWALRDIYTISMAGWAILQLVWVTMLIVVQSLQIAKGITTYENMKRHDHGETGPSHLPIHNARPTTLGANSEFSGLNDAAASSTRIDPIPRKPDGWFTKLKRTLGIDVFFKTASDASAGKIRDRSNPFSRGPIGNCKDFWLDPAPMFFRRKNGAGFLAGEVVDYNTMYEKPNLLKRRGPLASRGEMRYEQLATDEDEHE